MNLLPDCSYRYKTLEELYFEIGKEVIRQRFGWGFFEEHYFPLAGKIVNPDKSYPFSLPSGLVTKLNPEELKRQTVKRKEIRNKLIITNSSKYETDFKYYYNSRDWATNFTICNSPTYNCQLSSIGAFNNLLSRIDDPEELNFILIETAILSHNRPLLLFDVHNKVFYIDKIKKLNVVTMSPYISTNYSEMVYGLINLQMEKYELR